MGLTKFPNGILATPNIGGCDRSEMFESGNIWFVDGDNGSASNAGTSPDVSFALPTTAVTAASMRGIVYVRPRDTVAAAQTYYVDNITIPLTKSHLQILGCAPDSSMPYFGPMIKASTVTSPVLIIKSAGCLIEGLELTGTGQTADVTSIVETQNNGTTTRAYGVTIRGNTFRNAKGHTIGLGAALHMDTAIYMKIQGNLFRDNPVSIVFQTTYAAVNSLIIQKNVFSGPVATRDVDIWCDGSAGTGLLIHDNQFPDALPALTDGAIKKYISLNAGLYGMVSENKFGYAAGTADALFAATGTIANIPTTVMMVNNQVQMDGEGETGVLTV